MFKEFLNIWKNRDFSIETLEESVQTLKLDNEMFIDSVKALRIEKEGGLADEVLLKDKQINKSERNIRKKVLTHLCVSDKTDISAGLILTSIVIDIERIGDYTKNIADLAILYKDKILKGYKFDEEITEMENKIKIYFDYTIDAFANSNEEAARNVTSDYKQISGLCTEMKIELISGNLDIPVSDAVSLALYMRFLKRVAAHLYNICTSIVNPFPRIGYGEKNQQT